MWLGACRCDIQSILLSPFFLHLTGWLQELPIILWIISLCEARQNTPFSKFLDSGEVLLSFIVSTTECPMKFFLLSCLVEKRHSQGLLHWTKQEKEDWNAALSSSFVSIRYKIGELTGLRSVPASTAFCSNPLSWIHRPLQPLIMPPAPASELLGSLIDSLLEVRPGSTASDSWKACP